MTKFITSIVARKNFLVLLIGLWLAASAAGYFIGTWDNKKALSRAVIDHNTNIHKSGAEVLLVYTCNNKEASYDVGNHLVLKVISNDSSGPTEGLLQGAFTRGMTGLEGAVGSGLGTGLVHAIMSKSPGPPKKALIRQIAVGTILAASGLYALYVGLEIGSQQQPVCDDAKILQEISKDDFWERTVKSLARNLWQQADHLADLNEISPDRRPVLKRALVQIQSNPADSNSFATLLDELGDRYRKDEHSPEQWTLVHLLMYTTANIFVTTLLAYLLLALSEAWWSPKKTRKSNAK